MITDKQQKNISKAIFKLLQPLARFLLRNGVPYTAFKDIAKRAFVDVAQNEFELPGKKQTISRIATITGLSRKEIRRVIDVKSDHDEDMISRYNRAARVVYGWVHNPDYADATKNTAILPLEGPGATFSTLVKTYSGDVPARAILDDLVQVGVVKRLDENRVQLLSRAYIPTMGDAEKLTLLGRDVSGLISTMDKNIHKTGAKPFFQRKVFYDNLPEQATEELHAM